ncbi:MAG: type II toxin-antitoxin system HicA family toxin [Candidatus Sericytochromatia bacterium]|nr:type II toxin-antitoxin system HicA family toxin [Candidatus Sericytochromatia bacterium]
MSSEYPPITSKDAIFVLKKLGYEQISQKGSHKQFKKNNQGFKVTVADHGNEIIKNKTFSCMLSQIGIDKNDFYIILKN